MLLLLNALLSAMKSTILMIGSLMFLKKMTVVSLLSLLIILLLTGLAMADVPTTNAIELMRQRYQANANQWSFILTVYAARLFWILALIDFAWMAINLALNPGEFSDITANLIRKILFIGFFWMLVQPVGGGPMGGQARGIVWATDIVQSMIQAAGQANNWAGGTLNTSPARVFDTGYDLCSQIFNAVSGWSPVASLGLIIGAIVIMVCFALIAAMMLLMYVQSYIMIYAGVIFLGFGGSVFTKDIALKYFQFALATGAKLFVMILVVGLGQQLLTQWTANFTVTNEQIVLFIGASIVLLALVKAIPEMVGNMITGFSWGAGESLMRTTAQTGKVAAGAAIGATAGAAGSYMAVSEAAKLAGASGATGVMGKTAATVSNLGKASAQQVGQQITGSGSRHGTAAGRTAAILKENRLTATKQPPIKDEPYYSNVPDKSKTDSGSIYKDKS